MDTAETSVDFEQDSSPFPRGISRSLKTRLHSRIMAAAYKYRLMSPEEDGGGGKDYTTEGAALISTPLAP